MTNQVVNQNALLLVLLFFSPQSNVQSTDDGVHEPMLPGFPQPLGEVAEKRLEEENETDPLVIGVVLLG